MVDYTMKRVDEVSKYYKPIGKLDKVTTLVFWIIAIISLLMPYSTTLFSTSGQSVLIAIFLVFVLLYFLLSQFLRFYLVPRAERIRRKSLLSDSFGVFLTHDKTSLYYNNQYSPSLQRLGANTLENALFSKEISAEMLKNKRFLIIGYVTVWLLSFSLRHNNLALLTWITQLVFSGEIFTQWLKLEILHNRYEEVYEHLHSHYLHEMGENSPRAVTNVLDAFVTYEAAKASAGILLSSKIFSKLNPHLIKKWDQIKQELNMNIQQIN